MLDLPWLLMAGAGYVFICMSKHHGCPVAPSAELCSTLWCWWLPEAKVSLWTQAWIRAYGNLLLIGMQNALVGTGVARVAAPLSCPWRDWRPAA